MSLALNRVGMDLSPPITYFQLRKVARNGFTKEERILYWPQVVTVEPKATITELAETSVAAGRMFNRVKNVATDLTEAKDRPPELIARTVMEAIVSHYPVSQPGLLEPLVEKVARTLTDTALCFYFFCGYLDKDYWYSIPSLTAHRYKLYTFRQLAKRCMKNTYAVLDKIGALDERHLSLIFIDRLDTLFPEKYANQLLDMYFIEGYKILYRFGLALFKRYKRRIKSGEFSTGDEFWSSVQADAGDEDGFDFDELVKIAFGHRVKDVFKTSIVPRRKYLQAYEEETRRELSFDELSAPLQQKLRTSVCLESERRINENELLHHESKILDRTTAEVLHHYIVPSVRMEGFDLAFSTYDDGWNLQTLYNNTSGRFPSIILVQLADEDAILGMFMSSEISPPSTSVRGDGLCFCFRIIKNKGDCYRWVGHTMSSVETLSPTHMQYAVCASEYMTFGASEKMGGNAIRLSSDLQTCYTGESDTYCNPPLVKGADRPLRVGEVEVFCGKKRPVKMHSRRLTLSSSRGNLGDLL